MGNVFKLRWYFILISGGIFMCSCTKKIISFNKSTAVPAATGKIIIKKDKNSNYAIRVKIDNLASADRLRPPKDHYVLWMETDRYSSQNLGRLKSSKPLFRKAYKATLDAVTTYTPTRFFITAENAVGLLSPQGDEILTTDVLNFALEH